MLYSVFNNLRNAAHQNNLCLKILAIYPQQNFANKLPYQINDKIEGKDSKKKTIIPRITLIGQNDNISITTLEEAQKLSKRRDLKLVKMMDVDMKTARPVYKLMTGPEYLAEELKQREHRKAVKANSTIKGEKVLILSSVISEHDLTVHINKILKWISKQYEVRVVINGIATNMDKAESVYNFLESHMAEAGRIVQKRTKGSDIKFQILPPKKTKENEKIS